jgi:hypothetical protein
MSKTQIVILWGLAVLVVIVFAVLSQVVSRAPSSSSVAVTVPPARQVRLPDTHSLKKLYPRADQAARTWQGDALLAAATASWSFVQMADLEAANDWTLQFYSPSTQQLQVLTANEEHILPIVTSLSPYELSTVAMENWRVDSHQALSTWLNAGGSAFLTRYSVVDVSARLGFSKEKRLEWSVVGVVRDTQTFHQVRIDATSGEVIQ